MRENGRKKMGEGRGILFLCRMSSLVKSCLIVDQDIRKIELKEFKGIKLSFLFEK